MENIRQTVRIQFSLFNLKNCGIRLFIFLIAGTLIILSLTYIWYMYGICCVQYTVNGNDCRWVQFSNFTIHGSPNLSKCKFVRSHFAKENTSQD